MPLTNQACAQVENLARMTESEVRQLDFLDTGSKAAIEKVQKAVHTHSCLSAIVALKNDSDFQEDMQKPEMLEAFEDIRKTNTMDRQCPCYVISPGCSFALLLSAVRGLYGR